MFGGLQNFVTPSPLEDQYIGKCVIVRRCEPFNDLVEYKTLLFFHRAKIKYTLFQNYSNFPWFLFSSFVVGVGVESRWIMDFVVIFFFF